MTTVLLSDRTYEWRGLTLQHSDSGCEEPDRGRVPYEVVAVDGIEGTSNRIGDVLFPRSHGAIPGMHLADPREITVRFLLAIEDREVLERRLLELQSVFQVIPDPDDAADFRWQMPGQPAKFATGRPLVFSPRRRKAKEGRWIAEPLATLACADPRIYSVERVQGTARPFDPSAGGIDYPVNYPKDWPSGGAAAGDAVLVNDGNWPAAPVVQVFGPDSGQMDSVTLANRTTGTSITVNTPIGPGQVLTVDMQSYVTGKGPLPITLDGTTRYGMWEHPREQLLLAPGSNVLRLAGTGTLTGVTALVNYRHTWL